jgi:hypothetical protein
MKSLSFFKIMTLAITALLATAAYAAGAVHKGNLRIVDTVQVNGKQLPAGDYTVTWEGDGPNVDVHISKGKKEVASAPAKVVTLDQEADQDAVEVSSASGARELTAVRFGGKRYQIDVVSSASGQSGASVR